MTNFKFDLGAKVRDKVTGFTGMITCRTEWLNRCVRYNVQPRMVEKEGEAHKLPDTQSFDEDQLELADPPAAVAAEPVPVAAERSSQRTGGDFPTQTRAPDPR